jgi:hypothetical protein
MRLGRQLVVATITGIALLVLQPSPGSAQLTPDWPVGGTSSRPDRNLSRTSVGVLGGSNLGRLLSFSLAPGGAGWVAPMFVERAVLRSSKAARRRAAR